jgi:hypothetical protein
VSLTAVAEDTDDPEVLYTYNYTVSGGRIVGSGKNTTWELSGVQPGDYLATVEVVSTKDLKATDSVHVRISSCLDCVLALSCPTVDIECPVQSVTAGAPAVVTANAKGMEVEPDYEWTVKPTAPFTSSQTGQITIDTKDLPKGSTISVKVEVTNIDVVCPIREKDCTFKIAK